MNDLHPQHTAPRRSRGWQWPIGMAVILASTVGLNLAVMAIAADDPSFAVEPDYYAKAVAWDSIAASRSASAALGWHATAVVTTLDASGGTLVVTLRDATGARIADAELTATVLHVARAGAAESVAFTAREDGSWESRVPIVRRGQWEVRLRAERGEARDAMHFEQVLRVEAPRDDR